MLKKSAVETIMHGLCFFGDAVVQTVQHFQLLGPLKRMVRAMFETTHGNSSSTPCPEFGMIATNNDVTITLSPSCLGGETQ